MNFERLFQSLPGNYIILLPDAPKFTIVSYNEARAKETFTRKEHVGQGIFDAFPDNPDDPGANGVAMLRASLEIVMRTRQPHTMAVQKYDILAEDMSRFEPRYWLPKNIPVMDNEGTIIQIIHHVKDVTDEMDAVSREEITRKNFEDFFQQLSSPFAVLTGRGFRFSHINPAYEALMGHRKLEGRTVAEAIPELEGQPFMQQLEHVYDTGTPYHGVEVPATANFSDSKSMTTRYFNLSYTPFRNDMGAISGVLAFAHDVTEQVELRSKDRINQLNQQAYDLFMQAPVGICILKGDDHTIELANAPVLEIWGKDTTIIGKPLLSALPEIEGQGFIEILDAVKQNGESFYANEFAASLVRHGKSTNVFLNFVYQPYYEHDGKASGVIAIASEVTEQVVARKKIEDAEETSRLAIESADLGAYEIDYSTDEMITTPRFNAIWGVDASVARNAFADMIHIDDRPHRLLAHEESLKTGKLSYEARIIWPDNSVHWVRINGTVLRDVSGKALRLLGVIQEITEQKAFTEEMTRLVAERTRELQMANTLLKSSNVELQQFAHITSHDLQEPLRKIQYYAHLLTDKGKLTTQAHEYAEKISGTSGRMRGLINDLLEYSSLAKENSHFKEVNLNDILKSVLSDFELLIAQKNAKVNADLLDTIQAIPLQMNQLLYNLIGNALKFTKKNEPPLITIKSGKLSTEKRQKMHLQEKEYYELVISDNGIGFEQEYAENIFKVFQRLNSRNEYEGNGIGLSVCSKVVSNHNGIILAEGVPNMGAKFTIVLPFDRIYNN